jgi:GNAT superfamily N-acetyltransferase
MSIEYEVRQYRTGDELQIVPLLILTFKVWPFFDIDCSPIDHWWWRYLDFYQDKNLLVEVQHEDKIIATDHVVLENRIIKGKHYLTSYGTDGCVHPSFQGRGLYKKMLKTLHQWKKTAGVKFAYMITVNPKIINSKSRTRSWPHHFPHNVRYMNRINDLNLHIQMKELGDEYRWKLRHYLEQVRSSPIKQPNPDMQIFEITHFDLKINSFIEKVNERYDFILHRSRDYLNWRYLDPRAGNYQVRVVEENHLITGYSVLRINKLEEYHTGYFVDLLALPDRLDTAEALLLDGLSFFRDNQVNLVSYQVVEKHPYERLFEKYGFYGGEGNRHIFYNNFGDDDLRLENIPPEQIHFPFGDLTGI